MPVERRASACKRDDAKKKRRILTLPRPRLVCVLALLDEYERMGKDERKRELPRFDGRLRDAVTDDMAAYVGEVMSSVAFRGGLRGRQDPAAPSEGARGVEGGDPRSTTSTSTGGICATDGCAGTDTASPLRTSRRPQGSSSHAGASRRECTGATTTPHASAPSSPDCAP